MRTISGLWSMTAYNTSFQIENGTMDAFLEAWEKQGIDSLDITFYDGGIQPDAGRAGADETDGDSSVFDRDPDSPPDPAVFFQTPGGEAENENGGGAGHGVSPAKCKRSMMAGILAIALCGSFAGSGMGTGAAFESVKHLGGEEFDTSYSSSRLRALQKEDFREYGMGDLGYRSFVRKRHGTGVIRRHVPGDQKESEA